MRCAECGVETGQAARFCPVCGAPAVERSPEAAGFHDSLAGDVSDLAQWARSASFPRILLQPGYDIGEVDGFLEAIRDAFLGIRQPPLTADEVRNQKFSTTRLRPGYDEEEVDAFLDEVEARLRMRCAECGGPVTEATHVCAECGAPITGLRSGADLAKAGPGDSAAIAAASHAGSVPARISLRWSYLISLSVFLILFIASWIGINKAPPRSGLSYTMGWIIVLSLAGALTSLVLLLRARGRRDHRRLDAVTPED